MSGVRDLLTQMDLVRNNPMSIQGLILDTLEEVTEGQLDVVDATNPAVFLMEASACTAASLHRRLDVVYRGMSARMAETYEDLYRHMSDDDYIGVFGKYSSTTFTMLISEADVRRLAVKDGETNTRKLVIPRGTRITPNDTVFTLLYPIEIRILPSNGIQVLYDTNVVSPIQSVESNVIDWFYNDIQGVRHLSIEFPVPQVKITTFLDSPNVSIGYNQTIELSDQFYYCRVYGVEDNGVFTEYLTTHSSQEYDPTKVTAVLQVIDTTLNIQIPLIYLTKGLVSNQIRIDVYTTKGELTMVLSDYQLNAFPVTWGTEYSADQSVFSSPLSLVQSMAFFSLGTTTGGVNKLSFDALRERVVNGISQRYVPITPSELTSQLSDLGYSVVKSRDVLTDRTYYATRALPTIQGYAFTSGAACTIDTIQTSYDELLLIDTVYDNGNRITIGSGTLFKYSNHGVLQLVPSAGRPTLGVQGNDVIANLLNNSVYAYTPFHYVLDSSNNQFELSAYYLDAPVIKTRRFISENETTGLFVTTNQFVVTRVPQGYRIVVTTKSSPEYKALATDTLHCQLYFIPRGETAGAYLNGTLLGYLNDELAWEFILTTKFDVDGNDELVLNNFTMFVDEPRLVPTALEQEFFVVYAVSDYEIGGLQTSQIDQHLGSHLLPESVVGLTEESLRITLGTSLDLLWSNGRTVASSVTYERHQTDVFLTYKTPVYKRTESGAIEIIRNTQTGEFERTVIHDVGDVQLDDQGNPRVLFPAGSVVIDPATDLPVITNGRQVLRQLDLLLVDGIYAYATTASDLTYKNTIASTVVGFLENDIKRINRQMYDNSHLYLYPARSIGYISVTADAQRQMLIPSSLSFTVRCYLDDVRYRDDKIRTVIRTEVSAVIGRILQRQIVSVDELIVQLKAAIGDDVVSIDLDKLGPNRDISTFTINDNSARASVRRVLEILPDTQLSVVEDIVVEFKRHGS